MAKVLQGLKSQQDLKAKKEEVFKRFTTKV